VGVIGAVAALALGATAVAQEPVPPAPAPPVGNFGGGRVVLPNGDPFGRGNAVIGMRSTASGKIQVEATVRGKCGGGTFPAEDDINVDGTFQLKGVNTRRPESGVRVKTTYDIRGTLTETGVEDGVASATSEIRVKGQETLTCKSGNVPFKVRRLTGDIGTPGPKPNTRYYGNTSEKRHSVRRGIVLRVSDGGTRLRRALYGVTLKCNRRKLPDTIDTPRRNVAISAQGNLKDNVKSTFREARTLTRSSERFSGQLGSTGAKGTLSISERTFSRRTKKLLETCRTGRIRWTAAP